MGSGVEEQVARQVGSAAIGAVQIRQQGASEAVDAEELEPAIAHMGRGTDGVVNSLDTGPRTALPSACVGGARQVEETAALRLIEV